MHKAEGNFQCPIVDCRGSYSNVDTFRVHAAARHPGTEALSRNNNIAEKQPTKRRKITLSPFSKEEGCWEVHKLDTPNRLALTAASLYCEPMALHTGHEILQDPIIIYCETGLSSPIYPYFCLVFIVLLVPFYSCHFLPFGHLLPFGYIWPLIFQKDGSFFPPPPFWMIDTFHSTISSDGYKVPARHSRVCQLPSPLKPYPSRSPCNVS